MATASLSLVCALTGRRIHVFDSFEGLPNPDVAVHHIGTGSEVKYEKGDYAGSLDEVRANVAKFGRLEVCEFVVGFFSDTLPLRAADDRYVMIFEDADLVSSVRDVLTHAWNRLQQGCIFFTHEARDTEVVTLFFDRGWWRQVLGTEAPGLVGSGEGLPLSTLGSSLGYVRKTRGRG
jgi:O-methyltransferase